MKITFTFLLSFCFVGLFAQQRNCGTMEHLEQEIQLDPERALRLEQIENHTRQILNSEARDVDGVITIPVVVHVVWNTNQENISDAQVQSQIDVLNEDFRRLNSDADNTWSQASDSEIEFCLATVDPNGNPTNGITRTFTSRSSFSSNNQVKFNSSGGQNAWPASQYMNFWVCDLSGGLLGYAQFPGGNPATDGIVCDYLYVGTIGTATPPFNLGRTATHEVGHWLNLRHIWGDGGCGVDDFVADTPLAGNPNFTGLPCNFPGPNSCNTGANDDPDMFQNYMDYSDDACMNLFTAGQRVRMRALFEPGGAKESLLSSIACGDNPPTCNDGIQNGDEEGIDCGGSNCDPCPPDPTCDDGIQNGSETGVDCGGNCPPCATCNDGIQNGNETGVDCGGVCPPCFTCNDGIQNGNEIGVDCGGNCPPCVVCDHNLTLTILLDILGNQTTWDVVSQNGVVLASGGPYSFGLIGAVVTESICLPDDCYTFTIYDSGNNGICCTFGQGSYTLTNDENGEVLATGGQFGASDASSFCLNAVSNTPTCDDGIQNGDEEGVDCGGSNCDPCPTCSDGIQNGDEEGVDCGGSNCDPCIIDPTCDDGIQNGNETGIDCGGPDCPSCPTCSDGIQNGSETGVDCGGPDCPACPPTGDCGPTEGSSVQFTANPRIVIIHWDAVPDASSYQIRYRMVGTSNWTNATSNTNSRQIFLFNPSGTFEYQIRSLCPDGWSAYSILFNFTVGGSRINEAELEDIFVSTIYPNPSRKLVNMDVVLSTSGLVNLAVYDLLGRQVLTSKYELSAGVHQIKLDVSHLENGYHLVKLNKGGQQKIESFIKQ